MERYWCLRWLLQTGQREVVGRVLKESLVRLEDVPLVLRAPSLPDLGIAPRGARVRLSLDGIDLLDAEIRTRYLEVLTDMLTEIPPDSASDAGFDDDGEPGTAA
jgi:exoribonuclease-2